MITIKKKALVIDPEPVWLAMMRHLLESVGVVVDSFEQPAEASKMLGTREQSAYDVVVLDWSAPDWASRRIFDVCSQRSKIVLTGYHLEAETEKYIQEDRIILSLGKPINPSVFREVLAALFPGEVLAGSPQREGSKLYRKHTVGMLRGHHILLVEDNATNRDIVLALLEKSGIEVHTATNGLEAVTRHSENEEIELILMDIHMPIMDGYTAAKRIREVDSNVPIIAFTTDRTPQDKALSEAAGMSGHLGKPIDVEHFYAVLMQYLSPEKGSAVREGSSEVQKPIEDHPLPVFKWIDSEDALKRVMHNHTLYKKILRGLYRFADVRLDTILDPDEFKRTTHTIKGLSAGAGAYALHAITIRLDETQDRSLIWEFYRAFNPVIEELREKCLFESDETRDERKPVMTPVEREEFRVELSAACMTRRIRSVRPVLERIDRYALSSQESIQYAEIKRLIRRYQFKEALEVLRGAAKDDSDR